MFFYDLFVHIFWIFENLKLSMLLFDCFDIFVTGWTLPNLEGMTEAASMQNM